MDAVLSTPSGHYAATIIDISRTGARLRSEVLPPLGREIAFSAKDVRIAADIIWCHADMCAIEFSTPLATEEVYRLQRLPSW